MNNNVSFSLLGKHIDDIQLRKVSRLRGVLLLMYATKSGDFVEGNTKRSHNSHLTHK